MKRASLSLLVVASLLALPLAARAQYTRVGSFRFSNPPAGTGSQVTLLSPDESLLFVTDQQSRAVSVYSVNSDSFGDVRGFTFSDLEDASGGIAGTVPAGMATDPGGNDLYVSVGKGTIVVYHIDPSGFVSQIQTASGDATTGHSRNNIVYVSEPGGDFVYTNNDLVPNTVSIFAVNAADGTLTFQRSVTTGGNGSGSTGFIAAPSIQSDGNFLYAVNGTQNNAGSNNISVFSIDPNTGNLQPVIGSPFAIPLGSATSGSIALSADGTNLYAGTQQGNIVKYTVTSGVLTVSQVASSGVAQPINGLAVDAPNSTVAAIISATNQIAVLNTAPPMSPVSGSPYKGANTGANVTGAIFSQLGLLQQLISGTNTSGAFSEITVFDDGQIIF